MSKNLLNRYIWIVDTLRRHNGLTRQQLDELWSRSEFGAETPRLPRRTFFNYRHAIEDVFGISIECNPATFEYYIADDDGRLGNVTDWMLSSASMSSTLTDARDISDRIFLEDVPSSREYLSYVIAALKELRRLRFDYLPFVRSGTPKAVELEPYFLKIFKLRWYITGRNVREDKIKTYALDRMSGVTVDDTSFELPADFDAEAYFRDSFGIVFSQGKVHKVTIRAEASRAKYMRALPLHHSQQEMVDNGSSIFTYRLRLTPDLVQELLSYGPQITVLAPPELRAMMKDSLTRSLENYQTT